MNPYFSIEREMSKSDREWLETVVSSGTASDKASAFLLQLQEAPLYGGEWLKRLLELAKSKSRHESLLAVNSLVEAFKLVLPPPALERKLLYLKQRKWGDYRQVSEKTLLVCQWEDTVKRAYFEFLKVVEIMLADQIAHSRGTALRILGQLAASKEEQSTNVLTMLINKLGDPDRKLASRVVYYMQEVVREQPELTETIVGLVEAVVLRPGNGEKAQYYGATFLSQLMLTRDNAAVPERLVAVYVALLKRFVIPALAACEKAEKTSKGKKAAMRKKGKRANAKLGKATDEDLDPKTTRLAKVVAIGLNRALPYYQGPQTLLDELAEPIQALLRSPSFGTILQALNLYHLVASAASGRGLTDAFVATVEGVLARSQLLRESSSYPQLIACLYRILTEESLSGAFVERIVKATVALAFRIANPAFAMAVLLLVNEILRVKPALRTMLSLPADECDVASLKALASGQLWEIHPMAHHYDPMVAKTARMICEGAAPELVAQAVPQNPFQALSPAAFLASLATIKLH